MLMRRYVEICGDKQRLISPLVWDWFHDLFCLWGEISVRGISFLWVYYNFYAKVWFMSDWMEFGIKAVNHLKMHYYVHFLEGALDFHTACYRRRLRKITSFERNIVYTSIHLLVKSLNVAALMKCVHYNLRNLSSRSPQSNTDNALLLWDGYYKI